MIPPDLLARALDAYREHNPGPLDGFNAALSVLSAAWPVADGRLREALKAILSLGREERSLIISPWGHMAAMADIAEGALSPPSAPAADVRIVRVAVAQAEDGSLLAYHVFDSGPPETWRTLADDGYPIRLCIAEIPVPSRDLPTVRASVEAAHD